MTRYDRLREFIHRFKCFWIIRDDAVVLDSDGIADSRQIRQCTWCHQLQLLNADTGFSNCYWSETGKQLVRIEDVEAHVEKLQSIRNCTSN